jgi:hypothetical protein
MKANERFPRSLSAKIAIGSLSILALSMFFLWRVHQGKSDICIENGRILNPGELRQAVLQNLVNIEVEATNVQLSSADVSGRLFFDSPAASPPSGDACRKRLWVG